MAVLQTKITVHSALSQQACPVQPWTGLVQWHSTASAGSGQGYGRLQVIDILILRVRPEHGLKLLDFIF